MLGRKRATVALAGATVALAAAVGVKGYKLAKNTVKEIVYKYKGEKDVIDGEAVILEDEVEKKTEQPD